MSHLESLSQQIHATLLSPPAKFLLTSGRALDDQWWKVRLFWNGGGGDGKTEVRVWTADINLDEVSVSRFHVNFRYYSAVAAPSVMPCIPVYNHCSQSCWVPCC